MTLVDFKQIIREADPEALAEDWLTRDRIHLFPSPDIYASFLNKIMLDWPESELITIAGSANWKYSLSPKKGFSEFSLKSDVDVAVVSYPYFKKTWEDLRVHHERAFYNSSQEKRDKLNKIGVNVYCGLSSPKWNKGAVSDWRFEFVTKLEKYSDDSVAFRKANMMFFKSSDDLIHYYKRGIKIAKGRV